MNNILEKYTTDIERVFNIGVEVLNGARSMRRISFELKLLAINGIIQAAKIGNNQGQSLITLSGFLSDLPSQIAPELNNLEHLTGVMAREITISSISVRRLTAYLLSLYKSIEKNNREQGYNTSLNDINLLKSKEIKEIITSNAFSEENRVLKENIIQISKNNIDVMNSINDMFITTQGTINKARQTIERIKRNGFIANYMGSYISIEASYLKGGRQKFSGLVNHIKDIYALLLKNLEEIEEKIDEGDFLLKNLVKSGINL